MARPTRVLVVLMLASLVVAGCAGPARRARAMVDIRQLLQARMQAHMEGKTPKSLEDVREYIELRDLSAYEVTEHWAKKGAPANAIVVRERVATRGKRIVGRADGSVEEVAE